MLPLKDADILVPGIGIGMNTTMLAILIWGEFKSISLSYWYGKLTILYASHQPPKTICKAEIFIFQLRMYVFKKINFY